MSVGDVDRIRKRTQATAMLSLQHNECLAHFHIDYSAHSRRCSELGLVLERCPIRDFDPEDMRRQLPHAYGYSQSPFHKDAATD